MEERGMAEEKVAESSFERSSNATGVVLAHGCGFDSHNWKIHPCEKMVQKRGLGFIH
jgi:short subunit dehydrogenase-like uncharacterized protein